MAKLFGYELRTSISSTDKVAFGWLDSGVFNVRNITFANLITSILSGFKFPFASGNNGLQQNIGQVGIAHHRAVPNSTSTTAIGCGVTVTGTATAIDIASTNLFTGTRRIDVLSAATAGATAGYRFNTFHCLRGAASGQGGFEFDFVGGVEINVASSRGYWGLFNDTGAPANSQPSSFINCVFAGWDSTDTTLQIMHNDGSGTCTKINLGANFPVNTSATDIYLVQFTATPNASSIAYYVKRLNTGDEASGTITTDMPANNLSLTARAYLNNAATASAITLAYSTMDIKTYQ